MKPVSKIEGNWLFWRTENPLHGTRSGFGKYIKRTMNKARRRFYKSEMLEMKRNNYDR